MYNQEVFPVLLQDFLWRVITESGLASHTAQEIACMLTVNSIETDINKIEIDDVVFDKILLMKKKNVPEEIIYIVIQNSLDWFNNLDVQKFWHELGAWSKKMGMTKEEIKQDIVNYQNNLRTKVEKIPIVDAISRLEKLGLKRDFIVDKLLEYIVDSESIENEVKDIYADNGVVDVVLRMQADGWAEKDIIQELKKQIDEKPGIDMSKLSRNLPQFIINQRKVSAHDGTVKYTSRIDFLKYINPVLNFFNANADLILNLSNKYKDNNAEFARAFYDLYVKFRGWGVFAPRFKCESDEDISKFCGGFSREGYIVLKSLPNQEIIVNTIIHELMHFEQYLMLINTDIGIIPFAKEHIMQQILRLSNTYQQYDNQERVVATGEDFGKFRPNDMPKFLDIAKKRLENDFYHNALKIPYEKITPESPKYKIAQQLADSFMITYNHDNRGNTRFVYPNLLAEQMALTVGNAGAVMFRNIIMHDKNKDIANLDKVLAVAGKEI